MFPSNRYVQGSCGASASYGLAVLATLGLLVRSAFAARDPDARRQTGIILFGTALGVVPFLALSVLPEIILGPERVFAPGEYTVLLVAFIPLAYLYVLLQRRLFQVDLIINRLVVFFVLALLVLIVSFAVTALLAARFGWPAALPVISSLVTVAVFLPSAALQAGVQRWVSRVFYGRDYDPEKVIETLSGALSRTTDRAALAALLSRDLHKQMGIEQAALLLAGSPWLLYQDGALVPFEAIPGEPVARRLSQSKLPLRAETLAERFPAEFASFRQAFPWARYLAPLVFEKRLVGLLVLGRRNNDLYSARDLRILGSVAEQVALALTHVQLLEDYRGLVRQLVQADEQYRAALARDLHDAVLQDLCYVRQEMRPQGVHPDVIN